MLAEPREGVHDAHLCAPPAGHRGDQPGPVEHPADGGGDVLDAQQHAGERQRRPGVVEEVEGDLEILRTLAVQASRRWSVAADYDVVGLATDFADTLRAELDYLSEGHNAERFARNFEGDPDIRVH